MKTLAVLRTFRRARDVTVDSSIWSRTFADAVDTRSVVRAVVGTYFRWNRTIWTRVSANAAALATKTDS